VRWSVATKLMICMLMVSVACGVRTRSEIRVVAGSGIPQAEVRTISRFRAIELEGMGRIVSSPDKPEGLEIQADDNIVSEIKASVIDETLRI
jgi:hypothetical protein